METIDDLIEALDEDYTDSSEHVQTWLNSAADALIRHQQREEVLSGSKVTDEQTLRSKYQSL